MDKIKYDIIALFGVAAMFYQSVNSNFSFVPPNGKRGAASGAIADCYV